MPTTRTFVTLPAKMGPAGTRASYKWWWVSIKRAVDTEVRFYFDVTPREVHGRKYWFAWTERWVADRMVRRDRIRAYRVRWRAKDQAYRRYCAARRVPFTSRHRPRRKAARSGAKPFARRVSLDAVFAED